MEIWFIETAREKKKGGGGCYYWTVASAFNGLNHDKSLK